MQIIWTTHCVIEEEKEIDNNTFFAYIIDNGGNSILQTPDFHCVNDNLYPALIYIIKLENIQVFFFISNIFKKVNTVFSLL